MEKHMEYVTCNKCKWSSSLFNASGTVPSDVRQEALSHIIESTCDAMVKDLRRGFREVPASHVEDGRSEVPAVALEVASV